MPLMIAPAGGKLVQPGGTGQHHKNDAEGADRAERRAEQEAQQAAQEEDPQDEVGGVDPLQRMMDDEGEGAAGPPDGGEHTYKPEDNQDIPHAADAGPQHEGNVARRVPLPQGVPGETGEPEQERPQDAGPGEDAHGEAAQKDAEDNGFHIRFLGHPYG